jgi:hypothetical protein
MAGLQFSPSGPLAQDPASSPPVRPALQCIKHCVEGTSVLCCMMRSSLQRESPRRPHHGRNLLRSFLAERSVISDHTDFIKGDRTFAFARQHIIRSRPPRRAAAGGHCCADSNEALSCHIGLRASHTPGKTDGPLTGTRDSDSAA